MPLYKKTLYFIAGFKPERAANIRSMFYGYDYEHCTDASSTHYGFADGDSEGCRDDDHAGHINNVQRSAAERGTEQRQFLRQRHDIVGDLYGAGEHEWFDHSRF